jgi:hypothetical protein
MRSDHILFENKINPRGRTIGLNNYLQPISTSACQTRFECQSGRLNL